MPLTSRSLFLSLTSLCWPSSLWWRPHSSGGVGARGAPTGVGGASSGHSPWRSPPVAPGCWGQRHPPACVFSVETGYGSRSDSCRSVKYPYGAVMQKVADHSGQAQIKSFGMTILQFQNFHRQFKKIASIIETAWTPISWLINCYHRSKITDFTFCNITAWGSDYRYWKKIALLFFHF